MDDVLDNDQLLDGVNVSHADLIQCMINSVGCDRETARAYLDAEEWDFADAIISYVGDCKFSKAH